MVLLHNLLLVIPSMVLSPILSPTIHSANSLNGLVEISPIVIQRHTLVLLLKLELLVDIATSSLYLKQVNLQHCLILQTVLVERTILTLEPDHLLHLVHCSVMVLRLKKQPLHTTNPLLLSPLHSQMLEVLQLLNLHLLIMDRSLILLLHPTLQIMEIFLLFLAMSVHLENCLRSKVLQLRNSSPNLSGIVSVLLSGSSTNSRILPISDSCLIGEALLLVLQNSQCSRRRV